jgi:salicylate biosynthesis isochorismate synthase/menaquinone-specific isochorismate synthase
MVGPIEAIGRAPEGSLGLRADARRRLSERIGVAIARARRERRRTFASVTVPLNPELDVSACVLAARRAGDRFFCFEHPDRDRLALATLGEAARVEARGPSRFTDAVRSLREVEQRTLGDDPAADPARPGSAGPVWVGGFAFAAEGGGSPEWSSLAPAQLVLPEVSLAREGREIRLTVTAGVDGDEAEDAVLERVERRLADLAPASMPLADPDPVATARVAGAAPPAHYEAAVARAVERIAAGELEKIVLAREVRVHARAPIEAATVFDGLRALFPACYSYLVGTGELAFVGASPELLVRREGARAQTVALAGTTRRSADPAVDDHLGEQLLRSAKDREEQAIVARRIERSLRPVSVWVAVADEPSLVKVHNVQHLATPIRAQLAAPLSAVELVALLHPTPAVGGEPGERAIQLIPGLEGLDRGWYAGAIGWTNAAEDGEFCVAIRCALLRDRVAHLYAGDGIVRDSTPEDELAETEVKLQALLPLLL